VPHYDIQTCVYAEVSWKEMLRTKQDFEMFC
jgi:hypothetical protein